MKRARKIMVLGSLMIVAIAFSANFSHTSAKDRVHRVVIHVDDNDAKRMNMALNNAANVDAYYKSKAQKVRI